jgi:xylulokinase
MARQLAIGLDIGTTGVKALLIDTAGKVVAAATRPTRLHTPRAGLAEAEPAQWLDNLEGATAEVLALGEASNGQVCGIAVTGMVPAVVVADSAGRPLRRAILQNDTRAAAEVGELSDKLSHLNLLERTGSALTQQSVAPTLLWLRRNEPEALAKAARVQGSYDWVACELGAEPHVEQNWALESGLFDLASAELIGEVLDAAEAPASLLPPPKRPGEVVGELNSTWAAKLGLPRGIPIAVGGADHVLSAYAAGVEAPGDWLVKLGGAGDILAVSHQPVVDRRLYLDAHPVAGLWLPNGCMATSGSLTRWFQSLVGGASLESLEAEASSRPAADLLCLPYFLGEKSPLHDPNLRGAYVGLHLGHTRADLYRATLESVAFAFRHHTEVFAETGIALNRGLITNGGSRSKLWKQLHADILGMALRPVSNHPGASLGAAVAAALGAGAVESWAAARDFVALGAAIEPRAETAGRYSDAYARWRELAVALTPISHGLAANGGKRHR